MKYVSVYLNPSADRNPREKGKEQQIRRFAECQHSNDSEKYKTKQLTTQGNKCSCGKNHTLMPISLIALWFRQRAERQGVWALCAAVLQPGCHLGGWILTLPLAIFAFSFSTLPCKWNPDSHGTVRGWLRPGPPAGTRAAGWRISLNVCTHLCKGHVCSHVCFLLSHLTLCPQVEGEWRSPALVFRDCTVCPVQTPSALVFFLLVVGTLGAEPQSKKVKAKR